MATQITVTGSNPIAEKERSKALEYMNSNLSNAELSKLYQLSQSKKARRALESKWDFIKSFLM